MKADRTRSADELEEILCEDLQCARSLIQAGCVAPARDLLARAQYMLLLYQVACEEETK